MTNKKELDNLKKELVEKEKLIEEKNREIEEITDKIREKDQKIEDYFSQLQRMQADFENYKKRSEKEITEFIRRANEELILKIIEVYEDFQRALKAGKSSEDLLNGIEIIHNKLKDLLEKEGLIEIPAKGEKFDAFKHEALMTENHKDYDDGEIIEELAKGYTLNSKVIKYSKVKVCKKE
ncbi:MAG: nucleotide exchange factor GrpE [Euryarchaeota archaeon]|nr:nucleotide exchange factor GrpE [Euryarchaeota archaeon]